MDTFSNQAIREFADRDDWIDHEHTTIEPLKTALDHSEVLYQRGERQCFLS
jgi:hypothetical protein